jgi:hypothetical protein
MTGGLLHELTRATIAMVAGCAASLWCGLAFFAAFFAFFAFTFFAMVFPFLGRS